MKVPAQYKKRYDKICRSSGRAFADEWLNNKLQGANYGRQVAKPAKSGRPMRICAVVQFSDCARKYGESLCNPFTPNGACVPIPPSFPSQRYSVFIKGGFTVPAGYVGFVALDPKAMLISDAAGTARPLFRTSNGYAGSVIANSGTGVVQELSNSAYTGAQIGSTSDQCQYRLVSAGLRIKYTGTNLDRGGQIVGCAHPDHQTLIGEDITDLRARTDVEVHSPVTDKWFNLVWVPRGPTNYDYEVNHAGAHNLAFICENASTSVPYVFEAVANFEIVGPLARGKIPATEDVSGAKAIGAAMYSASKASTSAQPGSHRDAAHMFERAAKFIDHGTRVVQAAGAASSAAYRFAQAIMAPQVPRIEL